MSRLGHPPETFAATRGALHRVAEEIVGPARKPDNEIALTITNGGFGTPPFDHDGRRVQVRVDGVDLVIDTDGVETRAELTTMADAGALVGAELLPKGLPDDSTPLEIDRDAAERLADYYAFAHRLLDEFSSTLDPAAEATLPILWPEHFDVAIEAGAESAGQRANYGASPGDDAHAEPYVYVGPWSGDVSGELWNASGYAGAELPYAKLAGSDDPLSMALEFLQSRRAALVEG